MIPQVDAQRQIFLAIQKDVAAAANETKKPNKRARHQALSKHAVLAFFRFLSSGEAASFEEAELVADSRCRFSCPLLPAQQDADPASYSRSWLGTSSLKGAAGNAASAFPSRLERFLSDHLKDCGLTVSTTFEVRFHALVLFGEH